ncbi:MAG: alpha/beta hydrolase [Chloroflexia bacterium]|nr:alpha/beta hydrolase [Chloroflexia bacterium]
MENGMEMIGNEHADEAREVRLDQGVIRYRDIGSGPTLVFVAGLLANRTLWRDVVSRLAGEYRCVMPDLPLGGHSVPMAPGTDLSPPGVARIVADFMATLDLRDVTLVGNDTGGAICQMVVAAHRGRVGRLVLTNCDAYEAFLPLALSPFQHGARLFGDRFGTALGWVVKRRAGQRLFLKVVAKRRVDDATLDAYFGPFARDAGVRHDTVRFLAAISNRHTMEAAKSFPSFDRPVLIVWGEDDRFFSAGLARRLQRDFPDARLESVPGSRAFVPEDQPETLARLIAGFVPVAGVSAGVAA